MLLVGGELLLASPEHMRVEPEAEPLLGAIQRLKDELQAFATAA